MVTGLQKLSCPKCLSSMNLILFVSFKDKQAEKALCLKRYTKPSMVRKFHKISKNGCGHWFRITTRKQGEDDGKGVRHIHEETAKAS